MSWFWMKRGSEGLFAFLLWNQFHTCTNLFEAFLVFGELPPLTQLGVVAAAVLLGGAVVEIVRLIFNAMMKRKPKQ